MLNMKRPMKQVFTEILDECVIVVLGNGILLLNRVNILTDSPGANSIVVVNEGTANIVNSSFETKKEFSGGFIAYYLGSFSVENVTIIKMNFFFNH